MTRRLFTGTGFFLPFALRAQEDPTTLRGKLELREGTPSVLAMADGKRVALEGDDQTNGVLRDGRLNGLEFEVQGSYASAGSFRILPIHKRAMWVHKDGKRLFVTYWCAVCSIRTYTPGICWCCQDETALDLRENLDN